MAHQTFYIDIDEEITSIVEHLRNAKTSEVIIVVPKRALLIQSIVNLKLLKKEAERLKKQIILVTQDKFGKMLIEKTGILVEQKLDDIAGEEADLREENKMSGQVKIKIDAREPVEPESESKNRLEKIGSAEYFQENPVPLRDSGDKETENGESEEGERIINRELVSDLGAELKKKKSFFKVRDKSFRPSLDLIKNVEITEENNEEADYGDAVIPLAKSKKRADILGTEDFKTRDIEKDIRRRIPQNKKVEEYFFNKNIANKNEKIDYANRNINVSSKFWKIFSIFSVIAALVIAGALSYMFIPKVTITLFLKNKVKTADAEIKGDTSASSVDIDKEIIPAKTVSVSDELSESFAATGSKSSSNQKAHGALTIYNEYSVDTQPLVATTRFQTEDGKIFRLVKGTTVPGMQKSGADILPGAIEADVVADESGDSYNIGPASFTIPGFKDSGTEKYAKIYAKSFKPMTGGGNSSDTVKVVSAADVNSAKNKISGELNVSLKQKIISSAGDGYVVLDDAINLSDSIYTLSSAQGEAADNFTMTVKTNASAIVFREDDLKKIVNKAIAGQGDASASLAGNLALEYGKSDTDFKNGVITIRVHATGKIIPVLDINNLKQGILGKQESELKAYLSTYPDIDRLELNYWPSFVSGRIPSYKSRVDIVLDKN